ncbi:MAG: hypothetical protein K2L70_03610 [Clostridia bacterium]|nr:hypothetical protein [Clostridia bacterium]
MAKKKKEAKSRSTTVTSGTITGICCATAIVLSIIIFFVNLILQWAGVSLSGVSAKIMGAMNLIQMIAVSVAVCLGAYRYSRGKTKGVKTLIIACIIIYLVLAVVWGFYGII